MRQGHGLHDGGVADTHAVVDLKAFLQATQDGDGVLHRRLVHQHGLETAFQGRVLLDVLAVLVQGGGADAVQFATGQHGLEQVARVHGAFGLACAHDGVQLVDEEDDLAFALLHFIEHGLEAFLELAAVLGTGDQRAHVQGVELVTAQALGHVALDDTEGQAFHDGRLAHPGLTDEHGVVLGTTGQDAHHTADLGITADDRVHLALTGGFHQVTGVLAQGLHRVFGVGAGHPRTAAQALHGLAEAGTADVVFLEDLAQRRAGRVLGQRGEQMVHADVFVLHAPGFVLGVAQHLGQTLGDGDAVGVHAAAGDGGTLAQFFLHGYGQSGGLHAHLIQDAGHDALFLTDQGQRQMLAVDILMAHAHGDALRLGHGLAGFFREFVDVHISSTMPLWTGPVRTRAAPRRKVSKIDFFFVRGLRRRTPEGPECPGGGARPGGVCGPPRRIRIRGLPGTGDQSSNPCSSRTLCSRASIRSRRSTMIVPPTTGSSKSQQMRSSLRTR